MNPVKITFDQILPVWQHKLWPGRESEIKPMSSMVYEGGYDMNIYNLYTPTFWGIYDIDSISLIAVNSGHRTSATVYRSRGLYVDPAYRGRQLASKLFKSIDEQALIEECEHVWSLPRKSAAFAYTSNGYNKTSPWINSGMEFGPNCYVLKVLDPTRVNIN